MPATTHSCLLPSFFAVSSAASAQSLPRPAEFYFDADANTVRPVVAVRETGDAATEKLVKAIERNPRAKGEVAQLAHLAMAAGRTDLGKQLYTRALEAHHSANDGALLESFERIHRTLEQEYPGDWLLRWNVLESLVKRRLYGPLSKALCQELGALEREYEGKQPIASGLRYLGFT